MSSRARCGLKYGASTVNVRQRQSPFTICLLAEADRLSDLKASLRFAESHVFHSIRKTLVTLQENAGVSENLAADIDWEWRVTLSIEDERYCASEDPKGRVRVFINPV
jgi:hypothetical protein